MSELLLGFGIALLLEGLLWGFAPSAGRRMVRELATMPAQKLATIAWSMAVAGACVVLLTRMVAG